MTNKLSIVYDIDHAKTLDAFMTLTRPSDKQYALLDITTRLAKKSPVIIVVAESKDLDKWAAFLRVNTYKNKVPIASLYTQELWGRERFLNQSEREQERHRARILLSTHTPGIYLVTLASLSQYGLHRDDLKEAQLSLQVGMSIDQDELLEKLQDLGYQEARSVNQRGSYLVLGGTIDVYPSHAETPFRLEFFADELISIRKVDLDSLRSVSEESSLDLFAAHDVLKPRPLREEYSQRVYSFLVEQGAKQDDREAITRALLRGQRFAGEEYFWPLLRTRQQAAFELINNKSLLIFPQGSTLCWQAWTQWHQEAQRRYQKDCDNQLAPLPMSQHFASEDDLQHWIASHKLKLEFQGRYDTTHHQQLSHGLTSLTHPALAEKEALSRFSQMIHLLQQHLEKKDTIIILGHTRERVERCQKLLKHRNLESVFCESLDLSSFLIRKSDFKTGIYLIQGSLDSYVWDQENKLLLLPETLILGGNQSASQTSSRRLKDYLDSFKDLEPGSFVVHVDHGIGRYLGLTRLKTAYGEGEFLEIEYHGGDKIYLPVDNLSRLQKYNPGTEEKKWIKLDKLRSRSWSERKSRVKKAVRDMAEKLLKIHAQRQLTPGIVYSEPGPEYYKMEAEFPYTETEDQQRAINEVFQDMSQPYAMDRLICGDVGFGKTEVAIRAAFRAILDHYQVLLLAPTTVLSFQHYQTFCARLAHHGVQVALLNRFVSRKETRSILERLRRGEIDLLIGTHRLLSKDVTFSRLGLLIIDEEQRFGVSHKERIKEIKSNCDILTLSATPIPRTLHMAMLGLRDLSLITTPPQSRLPVKTYVTRYDEALVKEAVLFEINRGGQVFYVHNRVQDINQKAMKLQKLLPEVRLRVAHGQMPERELEQTIIDFLAQKFQLLLCTTIIESGVDMPHVNTLIVEHADRFGLAQMYQLRGRVGRSSQQAYAYFFLPEKGVISEQAMMRLDVITNYQDLGAGFQIASHDLEIRGAGNLLGGEQSGHIAQVGLDLYSQLLESAVAELKGEKPDLTSQFEPEVKINIAAAIPAHYIRDEAARIRLYKQLFSARNFDDIMLIRSQVEDRYGKLTVEVQVLLKFAYLKLLLRRLKVRTIFINRFSEVELQFMPLQAQEIVALQTAAQDHADLYQITSDYRLIFNKKINLSHEPMKAQLERVEQIIETLEPLAAIWPH